jgi:prevent-host-death family protein
MPRKRGSSPQPKHVREPRSQEYRIREALSAATLRDSVVSAADFKTNCLALMDEVNEKGVEFLITKHNRPVARLVPVLRESAVPFFGRGAGVFAIAGDIVSPTAPDWEEGADI